MGNCLKVNKNKETFKRRRISTSEMYSHTSMNHNHKGIVGRWLLFLRRRFRRHQTQTS